MIPRCLIYALMDPRTRRIHYVGASQRGLKRTRQHACPCRISYDEVHNPAKAEWLKSLPKRAGTSYDVVILQTFSTPDEMGLDDDVCVEEKWIRRLRATGEPLTNIGVGGPAPMAGRTHNDEARQKLSALATERYRNPEERKKTALSLIGHEVTDETRSKMSLRAKLRVRSPHSPETKAKMSRARSAYWARRRADRDIAPTK